MSTQAQYQQFRDFEKIKEAVDRPPFFHIVREQWLHVPNKTGDRCVCCDSPYAVRQGTELVADLIVDPITGYRKHRHEAKTVEKYDKFVSDTRLCTRVELPMRCYAKQLKAIMCTAKVVMAEGGIRGGKTEVLVAKLLNCWLTKGGPGCTIWWVAPELKHIKIAFAKLFTGEFEMGIRHDPAIPPEMVLSRPQKHTERDLTATLVDGTIVTFWHGGNAGQFKGNLPTLVLVDESAEVKSADVINQLQDRLMQSKGQLVLSTTPVVGAPVEALHDSGIEYGEWKGEFAKQVWINLTSYDNPWIDDAAMEAHIETVMGGDEKRIDRELKGLWTGTGLMMWRHWRFDTHTYLEIPDGFETVTHIAAQEFYFDADIDQRQADGRRAPIAIEEVGGLDFNVSPMSFVSLRVIAPKGSLRDPTQWVVLATDEFVEDGTVYEFGPRLADVAGEHREEKSTYYSGYRIACDATGAMRNSNEAHGLDKSSNCAEELRRQGFRCYPCNRSKTGKPQNPGQLESCNVLHRLMRDRVVTVAGLVVPRFMVHAVRCPELIKALKKQKSDAQGKPIKVSHTASDKLSGPIDAARYGIWPLMARHDRK